MSGESEGETVLAGQGMAVWARRLSLSEAGIETLLRGIGRLSDRECGGERQIALNPQDGSFSKEPLNVAYMLSELDALSDARIFVLVGARIIEFGPSDNPPIPAHLLPDHDIF